MLSELLDKDEAVGWVDPWNCNPYSAIAAALIPGCTAVIDRGGNAITCSEVRQDPLRGQAGLSLQEVDKDVATDEPAD